jgi:hypothetical protein
MSSKPPHGPATQWLRYLKEAFLLRWNLLAFGGASAAALLSPAPDVILPVVLAAEALYLGGLVTLPKFQAATDMRLRLEQKDATEQSAPATKSLTELLAGLEPRRRERFLRLRTRALEMQRIAEAVRGEPRDAARAAAELRTPALDRMLWVFVRLLFSHQALERFVRATDAAAIEASLTELETRERNATSAGQDERILRSFRDSIATARLRLDNCRKASANADYVAVELDRIENKIQALTEMAVSHQDPDVISAQVDAVAEGVAQTEATIRDLQAITGMVADAETPAILDSDLQQVSQ